MKYFFLAEGWTHQRVWEFGGLWNYEGWRREPHIQRLSLGIIEQGQTLWLYQVEEAILMIEVIPLEATDSVKSIGQVVLKRLITAEQALEQLNKSEKLIKIS
jgi:hypothetical protein